VKENSVINKLGYMNESGSFFVTQATEGTVSRALCSEQLVEQIKKGKEQGMVGFQKQYTGLNGQGVL